MASFSISYDGLGEAELELYEIYKAVDDVSARLYTTANKAGKAPSLSNKGYVTTIRVHGLHAFQTADLIRVQGANLKTIAGIYSGTEKRILGHLSELATVEAGFSSAGADIVAKALDEHVAASSSFHYGLDRALEDAVDYREVRAKYIEAARYWRSTEGSQMVKGFVEKVLGEDGMDNPAVKGIIKGANKTVESWEDTYHVFLNVTNVDSLAQGANAFVGMLGLGSFAAEIPRYSKMYNKVGQRAGKLVAEGHVAKGVAYALAGMGLTTVQETGDTAYNLATFGIKKGIGKVFDVDKGGKLRKNASKSSRSDYAKRKFVAGQTEKADKQLLGLGTDWLEEQFDDAGDLCWSRLDEAFGF